MRWRKGGTISRYLYDSWAILAHLRDPGLRPYFRSGRGVTTWLNLMEVYYALLRDRQPESLAKEVVASFASRLLEFTFADVQGAMGLRLAHTQNGRALSYVDAISYYLAQKKRLRFLTGDPAFRRLPAVTFVGGPPQRAR